MPESPLQYQNNDANGYPFYARNHLTKESRYVNYDFAKDDRKYQREQNEAMPNNVNQSMDLSRAQNEYRYQSASKLEEKKNSG